MILFRRKNKSIDDLLLSNLSLKPVDRHLVPILIIDDDKFAHKEILEHRGFKITWVSDIDVIDFVHNYEIILCDINGVGKNFGSKYDGAYIISEIRKRYPFKYIIAYTGYTHDPEFTKHLAKANLVLNKDIDTDQWVEELETAIENIVNPINRWKFIRNYLLDKGLSLNIVANLEDEYVNAIESGEGIANFPKKKTKRKLPEDVRAILNSFTASVIFRLIFAL